VGTVAGGAIAAGSARDATNAGERGANNAIAYERESRDLAIALSNPQRQAGYTALAGLMDMAGLSRGSPPPGAVTGAPGAGGQPVGDGTPFLGQPVGDGTPFPMPGTRPTPLTGMVEGRYYAPKPADFSRGANDGGQGVPADYQFSDQDWIDFQNMRYDDNKSYKELAKEITGRRDGAGKWHSNSAKAFDFESYFTRTNAGSGTGPNSQGGLETQYGVPDLAGIPKFNWQANPGYKFRMQQQMDALQNSAFAKGGGLSGGFAKDAMTYSGNLASAEYQNVFNQLGTIAGYGTGANASGAQAAVSTGQGMANAAGSAGANRASGIVAQGNAWATGINQLGLAAGNYFANRGGGGNSGNTDYEFCHVARLVFGETNPEWLVFYHWKEERPIIKAIYDRVAVKTAAWLADKPRSQALVRWWMRWVTREV
jgi:hypothetical protein